MEDHNKKIYFEKIANWSKREQDVTKYKNQRNLVVKLNLTAKKQHFLSIQSTKIDNEKYF